MFNFIKNKRRKHYISCVGRGDTSVQLPDMESLGRVTIIMDRIEDLALFDSNVKDILHNANTFYLFMDSSCSEGSGDGYSSAVMRSPDWNLWGMLREERKKVLTSMGNSDLLLNMSAKHRCESDYVACMMPSSFKVAVNVKGIEVYDLMLNIAMTSNVIDVVNVVSDYLLMLNGNKNTDLVL